MVEVIIKKIIISRKVGDWFFVFSYEFQVVKILKKIDIVGVGLRVNILVILSDGKVFKIVKINLYI